jgi:hypothetical protein
MNPRKRMRLKMAARAARDAKKAAATTTTAPPVKVETVVPQTSVAPTTPSVVPEKKVVTKKGNSVYDKYKTSPPVAAIKPNTSKKTSGTKKKQ